jgi:hypothetical protein
VANPTTNYGFVLPTATDLVTDLPADFDVALQGVDTRLKALQPGTTLGDLAYSSATANTNTRLGIGSTGQVLTVAGGVPSWAAVNAAAYTSLASGSITSSVSLTSISGAYTDLYLVLNNCSTTVNDLAGVRINNDTTAANYVGVNMRNITGTGATVNQQGAWSFVEITGGSSFMASTTGNSFVIHFPNYAQTTGWKVAVAQGGHNNNLSTFTSNENVVTYKSTSAITRLDLATAGSSFSSQGTYTLYGVK